MGAVAEGKLRLLWHYRFPTESSRGAAWAVGEDGTPPPSPCCYSSSPGRGSFRDQGSACVSPSRAPHQLQPPLTVPSAGSRAHFPPGPSAQLVPSPRWALFWHSGGRRWARRHPFPPRPRRSAGGRGLPMLWDLGLEGPDRGSLDCEDGEGHAAARERKNGCRQTAWRVGAGRSRADSSLFPLAVYF